jgi:hypothetical protein
MLKNMLLRHLPISRWVGSSNTIENWCRLCNRVTLSKRVDRKEPIPTGFLLLEWPMGC